MSVEGQINALLVGSGFNLRKLLRVFFCLLFGWPESELELKLCQPLLDLVSYSTIELFRDD